MLENEFKATFKIDKYKPEFDNQIHLLIGTILEEYGSVFDLTKPIDEDLNDIEKFYSGRGQFWVALEKDQVIGTVALREVDNKTAKLKRMFVNKDYRGKQVGQALLDKALEFAKANGYEIIRLNTSPNMLRAQSFYKKIDLKKLEKIRIGLTTNLN